MKNKSVVVATFKSHDDAAAAIKALQQSVFDLEQLSLVESKQTVQTELIGFYQTGQRVKVWGELGAIWGMIIGSGIVLIPGFGHLFVAGPLVSMMVGALEGGLVVGGLSALGAAFYSFGIHSNHIPNYQAALKSGNFIMTAQAKVGEMATTKEGLRLTHPDTLVEHLAESIAKTENAIPLPEQRHGWEAGAELLVGIERASQMNPGSSLFTTEH